MDQRDIQKHFILEIENAITIAKRRSEKIPKAEEYLFYFIFYVRSVIAYFKANTFVLRG